MNLFTKLSTFKFLLFFFVSIQLSAQNITGKIITAENSVELSGVQIVNLKNNNIIFTEANGLFTLSESGTYVFSKKGYFTKTIVLSDIKFIVVELQTKPEHLDEIQITSNNFQSQLKALPTAVTVIPETEIENNNNVNFAPILNAVSGVLMHTGTLTTNKITIRGIGSRNLYGTSKIRAYYQEIPLTNGSGESTIEDIELSTLGRIEILKGPSSSMYGAGLGGTIQLIPNKGHFDETSIKSGNTFGSFGFQRFLLQTNVGNPTNSANIVYSGIHSDGYRENNKINRQTFTIATNHFLNNANKLTFIGNYIDLKAFIPSSVDENTYLNNPKSAAFTWKSTKGFEDYQKGLFGLSWQHEYNQKTKQYTSIFTSFLNSYESRPFNILQEQTNSIGLRTKFLSKTELFSKSLKWTVGGEIFSDRNSYQTFENLYQDFPPETGSVQGTILSNFKENRNYFNLFLDSKYQLSNKTIFSFGLNFNKTLYKLNDRFTTNTSNFTGDYSFDAILSPKFGLTQQITNNSMIYGTISHGFSPPTLEETLLPNNLINTNIKPESGWNYEIGSRGQIFNNNLIYDIALYQMDVKNLLVARRTSNDEFIGVNAGNTQYKGVELALNYTLIKSRKLNIKHSNSLTYNDFKFKEFIDLDNDYSGNKLTGVPKFTYNSRLNFESDFGIYGVLNYTYVGKIPMRDDNSIYSKKYQLVNSKIGYKSDENKKISFDFFMGINNLFNEKYASMLLINAGSFGNNAPRYYYPGEPINYYYGLNLKYTF